MRRKSVFKLALCQLSTILICLVHVNAYAGLSPPTTDTVDCLSCHRMTSPYPTLLPLSDHSDDIGDTAGTRVCRNCHYCNPDAPFLETHPVLLAENSDGDRNILPSVSAASITGITRAKSVARREDLVAGLCTTCHNRERMGSSTTCDHCHDGAEKTYRDNGVEDAPFDCFAKAAAVCEARYARSRVQLCNQCKHFLPANESLAAAGAIPASTSAAGKVLISCESCHAHGSDYTDGTPGADGHAVSSLAGAIGE